MLSRAKVFLGHISRDVKDSDTKQIETHHVFRFLCVGGLTEGGDLPEI